MNKKKKVVFLENYARGLKKQIKGLQAENKVLSNENQSLKEINSSMQEKINYIAAELERSNALRQKDLERLFEIKKKYQKCLQEILLMKKQYRQEIERLIKKIKRKSGEKRVCTGL